MVKRGILVLILILLSASIVAAETEVSTKQIDGVVIRELSKPAVYELTVNNNNLFYDTFIVDTLLDIAITPKDLGGLASKEIKTYNIEVNPSASFKSKNKGRLAIEYFVKGFNADAVKKRLVFTVYDFDDFVEIILPPSINAADSSVNVDLALKEDIKIDADVTVTSSLLSDSFGITLAKERQTVPLTLSASDKTAGVYEVTFSFNIAGERVSVVKELVLSPMVEIETKESKSGRFFSKATTITKTNNGNSVAEVTIASSVPVLASLFTSFTDSPRTRKEGGFYVYEWTTNLNPGESYSVTLKTNYYLPFIVLLLLLAAFVIYRIVTAPDVKIMKKAVRVRTQSGVFASKIIVAIKNTGRPINNVKVIDKLPAFTEVLKDKFGVVTPNEIKKNSIIWDFDRLESGEERMFSYIVFSKINVFGRLEVPSTVVTYRDERDNFKESIGEKIYILSEEEKPKEEF